MAEGTYVTLERRRDGVALIRLDRPKANALSAQVLLQLRGAVDDLADDPPGAVVIWGGERVFSAGADISELGEDTPAEVGGNFQRALDALSGLPRVSIAAINGYALGGGLELALACDLRICAEDSRLGLPEILLGVFPGGGGTQRLPRLVGPSRAKELVLTGRHVLADEAAAIGLVNEVTPAGRVLDAGLELAGRLARGALVAQGLAKEAIDRGLEVTLAEGMAIERSRFVAVHKTADAAIGIRSFLEEGPGKAKFIGR